MTAKSEASYARLKCCFSIKREREREREKEGGWEGGRERDKERETERDKESEEERQRETETETERQRETERDSKTFLIPLLKISWFSSVVWSRDYFFSLDLNTQALIQLIYLNG